MKSDPPPDSTELRNFGLLTGGLTATIFGLALPMLRHRTLPGWPWVAALSLIAAAVIWPASLRYIHWCWIRIGFVLGWINSRIILTILFFLVIMPMGALMRAMGRDPAARRLDPATATYRVPSRARTRESMGRPF